MKACATFWRLQYTSCKFSGIFRNNFWSIEFRTPAIFSFVRNWHTHLSFENSNFRIFSFQEIRFQLFKWCKSACYSVNGNFEANPLFSVLLIIFKYHAHKNCWLWLTHISNFLRKFAGYLVCVENAWYGSTLKISVLLNNAISLEMEPTAMI
jgi:hypothetical protein